MKPTNILPALIMGVSVVLLGLFLKTGIENIKKQDRTVNVKGLSVREVKANHVIWPIVHNEVGNDLQEMYASIEKKNQIILSFLRKQGISDEEISIGQMQTQDGKNIYSNQQSTYRYHITANITVSTDKVDLVCQLLSRYSELLKEGVAISGNGDYENPIQFQYTKLNDIKLPMIEEATKKAREAGEKFAQDSGSKLGKIKEANQGVISMEDRDPYSKQYKTIRVVTSVTYYLED
jgi:hypothetical protein